MAITGARASKWYGGVTPMGPGQYFRTDLLYLYNGFLDAAGQAILRQVFDRYFVEVSLILSYVLLPRDARSAKRGIAIIVRPSVCDTVRR